MVYAFQEAEKEVVIDEKVNNVPLKEKTVNHEPLLYADKLVCIIDSSFSYCAFSGINILTVNLSTPPFRKQKIYLKHFWSLQMLGLNGPGTR